MLGLIADDLTGAGDASVQFAKRGWDVFLALEVRPKPDTTSATGTTVIAVTTDSRALSHDAAQKLTCDALTTLMQVGIDRVFLKIDSTMRGSVRGQVAGALAAWSTRYPDARAMVCPAYPKMGRTVESGRLLVRGEPVERTAFGCDPVSPVATSDMSLLLPPSARTSVVDAATDGDLMNIAASISAAGPSVIPVGSGGLAEAVAATSTVRSVRLQPDRPGLPPDIIKKRNDPRILLQVSSLNPVSHAQVARLQTAFPDVVVLRPPLERGDSTAVAENLAREFRDHLAREHWDVLGLVGGDGARATLKALGAAGIRIVGNLIEGIPLGIVIGGQANGTAVFTKAGGFGDEDALVQCIERLTASREAARGDGAPQAERPSGARGPREREG